MAFVPSEVRTDRLPKLRKGHIFKIANGFYEIEEVKRSVKYRAEAGAHAAPGLVLNLTTNVFYTNITGDLSVKRVVHLQYLGLTTLIGCLFNWLTEPLMSSWIADNLDSNLAGLGGILATTSLAPPYEIDKWSYDQAMHLRLVKAAGAQTIYWLVMEYKVKDFAGTPKVYLELFPNGEAVFHGF